MLNPKRSAYQLPYFPYTQRCATLKNEILDKIGKLKISENEILKYQIVEDFFLDNNKVFLISKKGAIDFSLVTEIIKQADDKPNLYGILVKKPSEIKWTLKYIGQRKSNYIRDRLRQHLYKKHKKKVLN